MLAERRLGIPGSERDPLEISERAPPSLSPFRAITRRCDRGHVFSKNFRVSRTEILKYSPALFERRAGRGVARAGGSPCTRMSCGSVDINIKWIPLPYPFLLTDSTAKHYPHLGSFVSSNSGLTLDSDLKFTVDSKSDLDLGPTVDNNHCAALDSIMIK
ncbi:hypothetical protein EVAR_57551_1 [Eumeta japonica]|uniref:Uncharacterized protein n=1 Tax=Eumeta variegata TaxID=151549 RepID=A0A4C1Y093_EUMVA|nr:hypothetical protein EVAR_57551_1 [Eumeta japonica]